MGRERPKISAREWADKPDTGFEGTYVRDNDVEVFEPEGDKTYNLEIIPYQTPATPGPAGENPNATPGNYYYERTFYVHRGIGADNRTYTCARRTAGKRCVVCEEVDRLRKQKNADEDLIRDLAPKQRQLWNVWDRDEPGKGVQLWDISFHLFGKQLKKEIRAGDENDGYEYFADFDEGLTVRVYMEKASIDTNSFLQAGSISFRPRRSPVPDEVFNAALILDNYIIMPDQDKLHRVFYQEEGVDATDGSQASRGSGGGGRQVDAQAQAPAQQQPAQEALATPPARAPQAATQPQAQQQAQAAVEVTLDDLGLVRGDTVSYQGHRCTILKQLDACTVNLVRDSDDAIIKAVPAAELRPPKAAQQAPPPAQAQQQAPPPAQAQQQAPPPAQAQQQAAEELPWDNAPATPNTGDTVAARKDQDDENWDNWD